MVLLSVVEDDTWRHSFVDLCLTANHMLNPERYQVI